MKKIKLPDFNCLKKIINNIRKYFNNKIIIISCLAAVFIVITVTVILCAGKIKAFEPKKLSEITDKKDIEITAYGGLSSAAPENTLEAFNLAGEKNFKSVYFKIAPAKDNIWVVSNYEKINKMTNGKGKISDYTYFELADFSVDNGANSKKYENLKIQSLDNILKCCLKNGLAPVIEIENCSDLSLKKLLSAIKENGYEDSCRLVSENHDILEKIHSKNIKMHLIYKADKLNNKEMEKCLEYPDIGVMFLTNKKKNNKDKLNKLSENGIQLYCFISKIKQTEYYTDCGIKNFITNEIIP